MRRSDGFASTWPRRAGRSYRGKSSWLGQYLVSTPCGTATELSFALTTGSESNAKFYDFAFRLGLFFLAVPSPETGPQRGWMGLPGARRPANREQHVDGGRR